MAAPDLYPYSVGFAAGAATSDTIVLNNCHLLTIVAPAAWTAANLAVDGSQDGVNWTPLGDQTGALFSFPVTVGRGIHLPPSLGLSGWEYMRLRSVSAADATSNVVQVAASVVTGAVKRYA